MHLEHHLSAFGWNERVAALLSESTPSLRPGRVARVDRGWATAVTEQGVERLPTRGHPVATGDWILVSASDPPTVAEIAPRWSTLERHDPGRAAVAQVLAANVDIAFVLDGLDRGPNLGRLERLLTLVWSGGAVPVVVLSKADVVAAPQDIAAEVETATVGVDVVVASTVTGDGVDRLRALVPAGVTAVLLGESGAGKSSLVNALIGAAAQATGAVRGGDHKGRHTTRARELLPLPGGGVLLDTPGLRGVGLAAGHEDGVDRTFADVVTLGDACRFRDCRHSEEPGCAVLEAVGDGRLEPSRLESFRALQREVAAATRRADVRADRAASRAWGRQYKQLKEDLRRRGRYP